MGQLVGLAESKAQVEELKRILHWIEHRDDLPDWRFFALAAVIAIVAAALFR